MHRFRFHFNTQYAIELREAINDRQKQSMVNIHKDRQIKGDYFAWDRTCAAMDRLEDTLEYFNNIELGNCSSVRTAFDFYDFINNSYIVIDCIKTIGQIFRIEEQLIENIEKSTVWDLTRPRSHQAAAALGTLWQQPCSVQRTAACNGRCRRKCRISSSQSVCFRPAPQSLSTRCRTTPLSTRSSSAAVLR